MIMPDATNAPASGEVSRQDSDRDLWIPLQHTGSTGRSRVLNGAARERENHFAIETERTYRNVAHVQIKDDDVGGNTEEESNDNAARASVPNHSRERIFLREKLVKPVSAHSLSGKFVHHLAIELWKNPFIRVGCILIVLGMFLNLLYYFLQLFSSHFWIATMLISFISSFLLFQVGKRFGNTVHMMQQTREEMLAHLWQESVFDGQMLRYFCLTIYLFPTMLEIRTCLFLSTTISEGGWAVDAASTTFLSFCLIVILRNSGYGDPSLAVAREKIGLHLCALWVSFVFLRDVHKIHRLAPPLLLSAGTFLLSLKVDWFNEATQAALRLTLRDVMSEISDQVAQDEMLQLAMLRWIVDYWCFNPSTANEGGKTYEGNANQTDTPDHVSSIDVDNSERSNTKDASSGSHDAGHPPFDWDEMSSMLHMTTDQMLLETDGMVPERDENGENVPGSSSDTTGPAPSANNNVSSAAIRNLQEMLASFSLDEKAKPAVLLYKSTVINFPPSRDVAFLMAVLRRCPGLVSIFLLVFSGCERGVAASFALLPLAILELKRVRYWATACRANPEIDRHNFHYNCSTMQRDSLSSSLTWIVPLPINMDPVEIILTADDGSAHPLLHVWYNAQNSVFALERGLTVARCAQTTALAADFAGNIVSLTHLGVEFCERGWWHGFELVFDELMHWHSSTSSSSGYTNSARDAGEGGRYMNAAVRAMRTGRLVANNIRILDEENPGVLEAILNSELANAFQCFLGRVCPWTTVCLEEQKTSSARGENESQSEVKDDCPSAPGEAMVEEFHEIAAQSNSDEVGPSDRHGDLHTFLMEGNDSGMQQHFSRLRQFDKDGDTNVACRCKKRSLLKQEVEYLETENGNGDTETLFRRRSFQQPVEVHLNKVDERGQYLTEQEWIDRKKTQAENKSHVLGDETEEVGEEHKEKTTKGDSMKGLCTGSFNPPYAQSALAMQSVPVKLVHAAQELATGNEGHNLQAARRFRNRDKRTTRLLPVLCPDENVLGDDDVVGQRKMDADTGVPTISGSIASIADVERDRRYGPNDTNKENQSTDQTIGEEEEPDDDNDEDQDDGWEELPCVESRLSLNKHAVVADAEDQTFLNQKRDPSLELVGSVSQFMSHGREERDATGERIDESSSMAKLAGGGLAILGATAIGAVALAAKTQENDRIQETLELASAVRIEEIPDDDVLEEEDNVD